MTVMTVPLLLNSSFLYSTLTVWPLGSNESSTLPYYSSHYLCPWLLSLFLPFLFTLFLLFLHCYSLSLPYIRYKPFSTQLPYLLVDAPLTVNPTVSFPLHHLVINLDAANSYPLPNEPSMKLLSLLLPYSHCFSLTLSLFLSSLSPFPAFYPFFHHMLHRWLIHRSFLYPPLFSILPSLPTLAQLSCLPFLATSMHHYAARCHYRYTLHLAISRRSHQLGFYIDIVVVVIIVGLKFERSLVLVNELGFYVLLVQYAPSRRSLYDEGLTLISDHSMMRIRDESSYNNITS